MKLSLKQLTYIQDFDLLKIILSSADVFPGLYRFSSSWKRELYRPNFMKSLSYLQACHYAEQGEKWSKSQWLKVHEEIHALAFGESSRDSDRTDRDVGELLRLKAIKWVDQANSLSLAAIETQIPVEEIFEGTTYYLMGSLIRFEANEVKISYNNLTKNFHSSLKIPFPEVSEYIKNSFSSKSMGELFFKAEIIGQLDFDSNQIGHLTFNNDDLEMLMVNFSGNSPVFASVNYTDILPIRFAKLIGVTNVCL